MRETTLSFRIEGMPWSVPFIFFEKKFQSVINSEIN